MDDFAINKSKLNKYDLLVYLYVPNPINYIYQE